MEPLRFGVIGAGMMGAVHAANLAARVPGARLVAIADAAPGRAAEVAASLGAEAAYDRDVALLADPNVQAVVIASPIDTHAPLMIAAAERGLHIFCEKPLGRDVATIDAALDAVARADVRLAIGFHRRFDPSFRAACEAVRSGAIGEPLTVHIISRDPPREGEPRPFGDMFLDTTIHDFDVARWLTGSEIESVEVAGRKARLDDPDVAVTLIRFTNGVVGTIDNNWVSVQGYEQRAEVVGTKGRVAVANEPLHLARVADGSGEHLARPQGFFADRYEVAYREELAAFVRSVNGADEPLVGGADARRANVLSLAAIAAYRERLRVRADEVG